MMTACETKDTSNSTVICNKGHISLTKNNSDNTYEVRLKIKSQHTNLVLPILCGGQRLIQ